METLDRETIGFKPQAGASWLKLKSLRDDPGDPAIWPGMMQCWLHVYIMIWVCWKIRYPQYQSGWWF